jgi:predicted ATP-grasp superfamily ATP-dependent carboligase
MADELRMAARPTLNDPVLITAFRGWNDGGQGASLAGGFLARAWSAERFADIDPEGFFDFQATRPHVSLVEGLTRRIDWPENVFLNARLPGTNRDVVLLLGIEPNVRWRTFTDLIVGLAEDLNVQLVVTLGSLLADVPHTRPSPVTGSATDEKLVEALGLSASRYEGPTGIVGVFHDACRRLDLASVSLWAAVPHYVSLTPNPGAAKAICDRLAQLLEAELDTSELDEAIVTYTEQVSEAVSSDPDTAAYVEELEERVDAAEEEEEEEAPELPSGDALAEALTQYLRERESDEDEPGPKPH